MSYKTVALNAYNERPADFDPGTMFMQVLVFEYRPALTLVGDYEGLDAAQELVPEVVPDSIVAQLRDCQRRRQPAVLVMPLIDDMEVIEIEDYGSVGDEVV